ncbi:MAG TPA: AtpZ/AtpI family protein [Blastocatellia bacterium]|nr:AtpZ/AtpI family protein [Blastocatellia bacterium]
MSSDKNKQDGGPSWRQSVAAIGLVLAIPWMIGVPAVIGHYIDKSYDTAPLWFLVGLFIGLFGTAFDIYKLLKRLGQLK